MSVTAIIYCAGRGSRLKAGLPKGIVQVCGQTILSRMVHRVLEITNDIIVISGFRSALIEQHCKSLGVRCVENQSWVGGIYTTTQTAAAITDRKNSILRIDGDVVLFQDIPQVVENTVFMRSTGPVDHYQSVCAIGGCINMCPGTAYPLWSKLEFYAPGWFHKVAARHNDGPYFEALNATGLRANLHELSGVDINNTRDLLLVETQIRSA